VPRAVSPLALALALLAGCAPRFAAQQVRTADVSVEGAHFRVAWSPGDERGARAVTRAVEAAAPRIARWGALLRRVTITVHPDHEALEAAAQRHGYAWLRAWARYDTIDIQSPRTWSLFGASARKLEELLTHELTHCAMYQLAGDDLSWMYKEIPRWFSEGIATYTAGQGYRFPDAEALWRFYEKRLPGSGFGEPGRGRTAPNPVAFHGDPIVDSDPIYQEQSEIVYGAAHLAAEFLIRRYGEERVRVILRLMGAGARFPAAFKEAIGITDAEFAADFRRYVVWEGWRR
jgi:hypothetical protein